MDPIVYKQTHKRIRELTPFTSAEGDPIGSLVCSSEANNWRAVFDDNEIRDSGLSYGIPLNRILLLSPNRKVPAAYLPSAVSYLSGVVSHEYHGSGDPRECLPQPGDSGYGNMNIVHSVVDSDGHEHLYRYAPLPISSTFSRPWYEVYIKLVSRLQFMDGDGTSVSDSINPYRRQVDLNIGTPVASDCTTVLMVSGKKLVHKSSGHVSASTTVPASVPTTIGFGDTFSVPRITVDTVTDSSDTSASAGHVDRIVAASFGFPSTAATSNVAGLVTIGSDSDIQPVGSANSAGTSTKVAAADHVHTMSALEFANSNADIVYAGCDDRSYDFYSILKAVLPQQVSTSGDRMLVSTSATTQSQTGTTAWKSVAEAFTSETFSGTGQAGRVTLGNSDSTLETVNGLTANNIYFVTAHLDVNVVAAAGTAVLGPVPTAHELILKVGGITKKVNIPGTWTYSMHWTGTISWIIKAGGTSASLTASMPGTSPYVNIFGVECTGMTAARLR